MHLPCPDPPCSKYIQRQNAKLTSALRRLIGAIFLLPVSQIVDRCPNISRKYVLIASLVLFSLALGLATLVQDGILLDFMLGIAGFACAAHIPITSSLLSSVYSAPSTRRYCVFTFFLAGGNAFAVVFGSLGSGLISVSFDGNWRATLVYMAVMYAAVAVLACLAVPNMPRTHPTYIITSGSEDRYTLLGHGLEKRSSMTD